MAAIRGRAGADIKPIPRCFCVEDGRRRIGKPTLNEGMYDMKRLKLAIGLVVTAGLMTLTASSAMAGPIWVHCEKVAVGKWKNSLCTEAGAGEWETKAVAETSEITSSTVPGTKGLELEDKAAGMAVTCTGSATGTIGAIGSDSIKSIATTSCKLVPGKAGICEEPARAIAINLGWATRLEERGGELRDAISSLVAGKSPGWRLECFVAGLIRVADKCEGNITTNVKAKRAEGTVETTFDAVSERETGDCEVGGLNQGRVSGTVINRLRSGAFWVLASILKT